MFIVRWSTGDGRRRQVDIEEVVKHVMVWGHSDLLSVPVEAVCVARRSDAASSCVFSCTPTQATGEHGCVFPPA
jgi:hypothetical protein